jgi:selenocysteine lyase/cysteine desulfurase
MALPVLPSDFAGGRGYLNTTSIGIPPQLAVRALYSITDEWALAKTDAPDYDVWVERSRATWARLVNAPLERVAIGPQVSYFTGIVAASLPPGAEVVGYENDFPSLLYPFMTREDLSVRLVPSVGELADAVGPSTAVVAVSAAQFTDGEVPDFDAVTAAAKAADALTVVDATQACGWLPLDATRFDVLTVSAYKWLLSPRGTAFMYASPEVLERLRPTSAGWYASEDVWDSLVGEIRLAKSARRFDLSPAWMAWVGTAEALDYLERLGIDAINEHDVALANALRESVGRPPTNSPIVALDVDDATADRVRASGVRGAMRAGRLRVAFHIYNDMEDVDTLAAALRG